MSYAPVSNSNSYSTDLYARTHHTYEEAAPLMCAFNGSISCDQLCSLPWQDQYAPLSTFTGVVSTPTQGPPAQVVQVVVTPPPQ